MSCVRGVIFQLGSPLKVSIELPATSRHCGITEILLKATVNLKKTNNLYTHT